ncbi:PTS mannose/fructose/sorbose/N-acetylgalactosamine transporter subunit IIC [Thermoanaerobacterium thermosaccharolyticum]|uniref:PTS mannose/fructose/sorbose/N-acetylgalactosamine transporter subunit IIC n=1 Tax=Thermoanaerobacterium thermosaccharolyticum TaxID=1517 RepID=UPI0016806DFD|nr:PTS sugar transporter subunit IIC [Thermoanaerobacterium thermosaccharolyticum]
MHIAIWQILLLTLFAAFLAYDFTSQLIIVYGGVVMVGFVTGLIMGDVKTGLIIGGTMQLMALGVVPIGGSSVPDYSVGTLIGTAFAIGSGKGLEAALAVGIPVATLAVQLDVFRKMSGSFLIHQAMKAVDNYDNKKAYRWIMSGVILSSLAYGLPVFIALTFGQGVVNAFIQWMPVWLINGFKVAAGLLPSVGMSILLRYMPFKNYWYYALGGFFFAAYLKVPILGIALVGLIIAAISFKQSSENTKLAIEGADNDDEI